MGSASDVVLAWDAAGTLAHRNGAAAQGVRVYNTFTDASNYERGVFDWTSQVNTLTIGTAAAGTGVIRNVVISVAGSSYIFSSGDFRPPSNGAINLGSSTLRWQKLYIDYTNTGTVGAVTINKAAGRVNIAAAGTSVVVTNSLVTAASHVLAVMSSADTTGRVISVVPAAGSFTINTPALTAQSSFDFFVINAD